LTWSGPIGGRDCGVDFCRTVQGKAASREVHIVAVGNTDEGRAPGREEKGRLVARALLRRALADMRRRERARAEAL
jgi:hypothetical protein